MKHILITAAIGGIIAATPALARRLGSSVMVARSRPPLALVGLLP
jgi:hypothetical protein